MPSVSRRSLTALAASALAAGVLSACAAPPSMALAHARAAVGAARADAAIARHAPRELGLAAEALARANGIWRKTHDEAETNHLAYMATLQAEAAARVARTHLRDGQGRGGGVAAGAGMAGTASMHADAQARGGEAAALPRQ